MLIVFRSKFSGDVLMLSQHALPVLQAAGKAGDGAVPGRGIFTREQLDGAIAGIERAVGLAPEPIEPEDADAVHPMDKPVGLRQRAYPLLEMLRAARKHGGDVMWEPAPRW